MIRDIFRFILSPFFWPEDFTRADRDDFDNCQHTGSGNPAQHSEKEK